MRKMHMAMAIAVLSCSASPIMAADAACNRDCLAGVLNAYLQALLKHDAALLPTTRNIKYTENGVRPGRWPVADSLGSADLPARRH
jgi:hypothetical protein